MRLCWPHLHSSEYHFHLLSSLTLISTFSLSRFPKPFSFPLFHFHFGNPLLPLFSLSRCYRELNTTRGFASGFLHAAGLRIRLYMSLEGWMIHFGDFGLFWLPNASLGADSFCERRVEESEKGEAKGKKSRVRIFGMSKENRSNPRK